MTGREPVDTLPLFSSIVPLKTIGLDKIWHKHTTDYLLTADQI